MFVLNLAPPVVAITPHWNYVYTNEASRFAGQGISLASQWEGKADIITRNEEGFALSGIHMFCWLYIKTIQLTLVLIANVLSPPTPLVVEVVTHGRFVGMQ
jgi:hypothetical protein